MIITIFTLPTLIEVLTYSMKYFINEKKIKKCIYNIIENILLLIKES